jgi:hypothetical protein
MTPARRAPGTTRQGIRDLNHTPARELPAAVALEALPPIRVSECRSGALDPVATKVVASVPYRGPQDLALAYRICGHAVLLLSEQGLLPVTAPPHVQVNRIGGKPLVVEVLVFAVRPGPDGAALRVVERAALAAAVAELGRPTHRVEVLR